MIPRMKLSQFHFHYVWTNRCTLKSHLGAIKRIYEQEIERFKRISLNTKERKNQRNAFKYLMGKQESKGKESKYSNIETTEYLMPTTYMPTIAQKQKMFIIKIRMVEISEHFPNKGIPETCSCGESETMAHIYYCEKLNDEKYPKLK